jgi:hypothetical protein
MSALWTLFARWLVSNPDRVGWLIARAQRTPYFPLKGYMGRWWLVRPSRWLPFSIRIHHIQRADFDRNLHNHPWNFHTIVLRGIYTEELLMPDGGKRYQVASRGQTYTRNTGEYHRVASVGRGGVWTLFIMGRKRCDWGFMVGRKHIFWREYLGEWEGV